METDCYSLTDPANVIWLGFKTVPTKLYELLAAGRKIKYVEPRVEDQEALLARYCAHHLCLGNDGPGPTDKDIQRLKKFLSVQEVTKLIAEKRNLVKEELSAQAQTRRPAGILNEAGGGNLS